MNSGVLDLLLKVNTPPNVRIINKETCFINGFICISILLSIYMFPGRQKFT